MCFLVVWVEIVLKCGFARFLWLCLSLGIRFCSDSVVYCLLMYFCVPVDLFVSCLPCGGISLGFD